MSVMKVEDLTSGEALAILLLESPHTEELSLRIPLAGASGKVVSCGLLDNNEVAAGHLILDKKISLSAINTFQYALQLHDNMKALCSSVEAVQFENTDSYKDKLKGVYMLSSIVEEELKGSYLDRLQHCIELNTQIPKIVVCGFIAQSFFEYATGISSLPFGRLNEVSLFGRATRVLYVQHPSPRNTGDFWISNTPSNKRLRQFVFNS